jgi:hypothetical protein
MITIIGVHGQILQLFSMFLCDDLRLVTFPFLLAGHFSLLPALFPFPRFVPRVTVDDAVSLETFIDGC